MLKLAIVVAALAGAGFLGYFLANLLRLPQFARRISVVLLSAAFVLIPLFPLSNAMKLGIDLSGGTILVYQVKQPTPPGFTIDKMVGALQRRINPAGLIDVTIRGVGNDRVEIIIPKATKEDVERTKRVLTSVGSLEFRILANTRDHAKYITAAQSTFPKPVMENGKPRAVWVPVAPKARLGGSGDIAVHTDPKLGEYVLVMQDDYNVTGEYLTRTETTIDEMGRPAVGFHFNAEGGRRFGALTGENKPAPDGFERRLAIVLNGEVQSAPSLRDQIRDNGIITGDFSRQEVDDYVAVLNAGSLPGELITTPASELTVGPTLGQDTIRSGLWSMAIATGVVLAFMLVIYHLAGIVADLAVILNTLIVVGVMAWLHATWTLAGLAGLALTVGMAVDANVLIYERLREEQQRGRSLRVAIEYAFSKALNPILDSNITTLMSGVILYAIGTEQVKGFAVTLIIGLLANLFTAVFVCRLCFDIMEKKHWVSRLSMLQVLQKHNFDFAGKRHITIVGSWVLIILGLVGVYLRGHELLDIDFTGGTLAAVRLTKQTDAGTVRNMASKVLPDVAVETLQLAGEQPGRRYIIRTTEQNQAKVRDVVTKEFGDLLATTKMTPSPIQAIPAADAQAKPAEADAADKTAAAKTETPKTETAKTDASATAAVQKPEAEPKTPVMEAPRFPGGSRAELSFNDPVTLSAVRGYMEDFVKAKGFPNPDQYFAVSGLQAEPGIADAFRTMRLETSLDAPTLQQAIDQIGQRIAAASTFERLDNFGGQVAMDTQWAALVAILLGLAAMLVYLWVRFQNVLFGLGAVIATFHDVMIVLGLVALSRWVAYTVFGEALMIDNFKINLPLVAAFLTLVGYSVNDTIVVFDRIREVRGKGQLITWDLINESVNVTLSRTVLTAATVFLVSLILYIMGGAAIHGFAYVMLIGTFVGCYSSIYIASPCLIWFDFSEQRRRAQPNRPEGEPQGSTANGRKGGKFEAA